MHSLHVPPVPAWVSSGCSGFLPQIRSTGNLKLPILCKCDCKWLFVFALAFWHTHTHSLFHLLFLLLLPCHAKSISVPGTRLYLAALSNYYWYYVIGKYQVLLLQQLSEILIGNLILGKQQEVMEQVGYWESPYIHCTHTVLSR